MGLGRLVEAWNNYGIQMLVLISLVLQLLLFILPIVRRHKMLEKRKYLERLFKLVLWLAYQLADTTAIYVLGHMATSSSTSSRQSGAVMALWASLLLVHLGGQDTMTAYSLEDNRLWKRHLLTLLVQTAGVFYVFFDWLRGARGGRNSGGVQRLLAVYFAGTSMFLVGYTKFTERVSVLRASDMKFLLKYAKVVDRGHVLVKPFTDLNRIDRWRQREGRLRERYTAPPGQDSSERAEEDLKLAHELLYFCMCQFVDSKVSLSPYQKSVIEYYAREKRLSELVHLQLSLIHDLLYTKASAIHTWRGCLIRVFSWLVTAFTCMLCLYGIGSSTDGVRRLDVGVTYALLAGALLLETASSLRAVGSTWTYEILRFRGWGGLGRVVLAFRRLVRAAEWSRRRRPRYIGGLEYTTRVSLDIWWSAYGQKDPHISLFVDEIEEMVIQYSKMDGVVDEEEEKEKIMNSRGGLSLRRLLPSGPDGGKVKLIQDLEQLEFDEYLILWYHATFEFTGSIPSSSSSLKKKCDPILELALYMKYLFKKQPHMLPPPVRQETCPNLSEDDRAKDSVYQNLVNELKLGDDIQKERKIKDILWVWIEMLCYAASHCNRESHARELSNGSPEFATVLWVLRAALINANMKTAVSTVDDAGVRDKSPVATEGNNISTHDPSSEIQVLDP